MKFNTIYNNIPDDIIPIIFEYYGKIKFRQGQYINIIHKHDRRYNMLTPIISKKLKILQNIETSHNNSGFYFEFSFDICRNVGLCYDCNYNYKNKFEICYYDTRNGWVQKRTFI